MLSTLRSTPLTFEYSQYKFLCIYHLLLALHLFCCYLSLNTISKEIAICNLMQKKAGREIHFEGDVDGTEKKRTIIYIQARSNLEFSLTQELVPDGGKKGLGNIADGSSRATYPWGKPFPKPQERCLMFWVPPTAPKCRCWYSGKPLPPTRVSPSTDQHWEWVLSPQLFSPALN